jgi:hypothetical protein
MTEDLRFDVDGDGVADVVISDTNGHTVYVNVRWVVYSVIGALSAIAGIWVVV